MVTPCSIAVKDDFVVCCGDMALRTGVGAEQAGSWRPYIDQAENIARTQETRETRLREIAARVEQEEEAKKAAARKELEAQMGRPPTDDEFRTALSGGTLYGRYRIKSI